MQNKIKLIIIKKLKHLLRLSFTIFILSLISGVAIYTFAVFTEPIIAPSASGQDFPENILGANNSDNDYSSSSVTASTTGSIVEYLEFLNDCVSQESFGRGWVANSSGDGSTILTREICEDASDWHWFEDANGDGDYIDSEDGICVQGTNVSTGYRPWNGSAYDSNQDNSYIAAYECEGNFPTGTITTGSYSGIDSDGAVDTTWNSGDCALCQADCYDGKKDLPDQGSYTSSGDYEGPLTSEILKNWKGTRLPTAQDFFGFCGYKDGNSDYETVCSNATTTGDYGQMVGRTDECIDLSDTDLEWLSGRISSAGVGVSGAYACSIVLNSFTSSIVRFRAIFRP